MDGIQDLGLRIVQAARLAVAVHLYESAARITSPANGDAVRAARQILRRQLTTGGAGPVDPGESDGDGIKPSGSRLGDLVTDDERDGLMGHDAERDEDPNPELADR